MFAGVTVVGHDKEEPNILVNGFENPGSFVFRPIYQHSATIQQLGALADASQDCRQFVRVRIVQVVYLFLFLLNMISDQTITC